MMRSGRSAGPRSAKASSGVAAATTRQPQLRNSPPMLSSTSASSSITITSLPWVASTAGGGAGDSAICARAAATGTVTENLEPLPTVETNRIGWPSRLHKRSTMARPRPRPPWVLSPARPARRSEDIALLVLRNPRPAVPHLDIQRVAAPPTADYDGARSGVAHRIGNEIEHDPLQQDWIAARPRAAVDELERQSLFAGRVSEGAVDAS